MRMSSTPSPQVINDPSLTICWQRRHHVSFLNDQFWQFVRFRRESVLAGGRFIARYLFCFVIICQSLTSLWWLASPFLVRFVVNSSLLQHIMRSKGMNDILSISYLFCPHLHWVAGVSHPLNPSGQYPVNN